LFSFSQERLKEYTAINGITYREKDTLTLGLGSGAQGSFVYVEIGGWAATPGAGLGAGYGNLNLTIKKIKKFKFKGAEKVTFVVGGGNITNYNVYIDEAIQVCEVVPCLEPASTVKQDDKFDKLKKLKELYDAGVLTEQEFNTEKAKLLN